MLNGTLCLWVALLSLSCEILLLFGGGTELGGQPCSPVMQLGKCHPFLVLSGAVTECDADYSVPQPGLNVYGCCMHHRIQPDAGSVLD